MAWLATRPACPGCRLRLDRGEPDYWLGAILFNAIAAGVVFTGGLLGAILLTRPEPPWTALLSAGIGVMMVLPILSAPFIRLL